MAKPNPTQGASSRGPSAGQSSPQAGTADGMWSTLAGLLSAILGGGVAGERSGFRWPVMAAITLFLCALLCVFLGPTSPALVVASVFTCLLFLTGLSIADMAFSATGKPGADSKSRTGRARTFLLRCALGLALVLVGGVAVAKTQGAGRIVPDPILRVLNEEELVRKAVRGYFDSIGQILVAGDQNELTTCYLDLVRRCSPAWRKNHSIPATVEQALRSGTIEEGAKQEVDAISARFKKDNGGATGLEVLSISPRGWVNDERTVARAMVVAKYEGRFVMRSPGIEKLSMSSLAAMVKDPTATSSASLKAWLTATYGVDDAAELWSALCEAPVEAFGAANASELVPYRLRERGLHSAADVLDPMTSAMTFGEEYVWYSLRLEWSKEASQWLMHEVGKWQTKRVPRDMVGQPPVPVHGDPQSVVEEVGFVRQLDNTLCQSAALEMLFQACSKSEYQGGQRQIRTDLGTDPTAHAARVKWCNEKLASTGSWEMTYSTSLEKTAVAMKRQLTRGVPVVLSTRLTDSGHVLVVTGIRNDSGGISVRCHDPWGEFDSKTLRYKPESIGQGAKDVWYPLSMLVTSNRTWVDSTGGQHLSRFVVSADEWSPSSRSLLEKGYQIGGRGTVTDWEWLEVTPPEHGQSAGTAATAPGGKS